MQTDVCMTYSCSSHFSEQLLYITLLISSYSLEDIDFTRYEHFCNFSENKGRTRLFSPKGSKPPRLNRGTMGEAEWRWMLLLFSPEEN
jgi:hypothetical protein